MCSVYGVWSFYDLSYLEMPGVIGTLLPNYKEVLVAFIIFETLKALRVDN